MSGTAIELLFMAALKKTQGKQMRYEELIIDASKALLVLNGMSGDIDIILTWANPLPHDDVPAIQAAVTKQSLGYSKTALIRETGGDPDEEAALTQAENEMQLTRYSRGQGLPPEPPAQPGAPGQRPAQSGTQATQGGQ